jgi:arylformamidase
MRIPAVVLALLLLASAGIAQSFEERFHRLDRNGDGILTPDELPRERLFQRLDADDDGKVTAEEARRAFDRPGRTGRSGRGIERDPAKAPPPVAMRVTRDIPYAEIDGLDPRFLSLDVYAPITGKGHPVLVFVHGGGWRAGDKSGAGVDPTKARHFVAAGWVLVSVNYRLSPPAKHPDHVRDVARAIAWVDDRIADHGGDRERIYLMGHSAGAHLVALVATDARPLEAAGKKLGILDGVVLLDSAAYDMVRLVDELGNPAMTRLYENAFGADRAAWRDASPITHVAKDKGIPPFLIFHTGKRMAGETLSKAFVEKLVAAGSPALAVHAADRDHAGINRCIGEVGDPYTARVMAFLARPRAVADEAPAEPETPVEETERPDR